MSLNDIYLISSIILVLLNIYQLITGRADKKIIKNLVRSWQNHTAGIKNALLAIAMNPRNYEDKNIIMGNVQAIAQQAVALDQAMTEERFYDDKEIKKKREEAEKQLSQLLSASPSSSK